MEMKTPTRVGVFISLLSHTPAAAQGTAESDPVAPAARGSTGGTYPPVGTDRRQLHHHQRANRLYQGVSGREGRNIVVGIGLETVAGFYPCCEDGRQ